MRLVPHEFTSVSFPVKALKLILRDVKLGGESATLATQVPAVESDEEVRLHSSPTICALLSVLFSIFIGRRMV